MNQPISQIEINLSALDQNLESWRNRVGSGCRICAVVKADAYGLGAVPIAQRLSARGVDMLAVYNLDQATDLAKAGIQTPILVFMPVTDINRTDIIYRHTVSEKLHLVVHGAAHLDQIEALGMKFGAKIPVHIKVDTGLSRLGMSEPEADQILSAFGQRKYVRLAGLLSHAADTLGSPKTSLKQFEILSGLAEKHSKTLRNAVVHFAETHASLQDNRFHCGMVRLGLGLFGYAARECDVQLVPMMRWWTRLIHVRSVPKGTGVGYRHRFVTKRPAILGVAPVGFGDGYPLALGGKAVVCIGKEKTAAPVVGEVSMDQIVIDLTDVPGAALGMEVELISDNPAAPNALPPLVEVAGSSLHEMLCRLSSRQKRHYFVMNASGGQGNVATTG